MNQQLQQALARWPEITKTDKFQKYSVEDKRALRDWYFRKYILPFSKDKGDLEVSYKAWTDVTNKDVEPTWGETVVHGVEKGLLGAAEQAIKRQSPVWWAQEIGKRLIGEHRPEYVQRTEQAVQDWLQQKKEKLAKGAPATFLKSLGAGMAEATVDPLFWVASGLGELGIEQAGKLTTKVLPRLAAESAAMAGAGGAYGLAKGETPKQAGYEALAWGLLHGISRPALSGLGKLWRAFVHDVHPSGEVKPPEITREQFIHANREKLEQFFRWLDGEKAKQIIAKDVEAKQAKDFAIQYAKEHPVERTPAETAGMFKTKQLALSEPVEPVITKPEEAKQLQQEQQARPIFATEAPGGRTFGETVGMFKTRQLRPSELVEPVVTKVKNLADKENLASIKPLKNFDEAVDKVNKTEQAIKGMVKQKEPAKAIAGETRGEIKQPWEMTKEEFVKQAVQRVEEPQRVDRASFDKPQGIYTTPLMYKSPHKELGGKTYYWIRNPKANVLIVDTTEPIRTNRGLVGESAGIAALKKIAGEKEFNKLLQVNKGEIRKYLENKYPNVNFKHFTDSHDLIDAYGGLLAKEKGYDAILSIDKRSPEFTEYVGLTPNSMYPVSSHKQVIRKALSEGKQVPREVLEEYKGEPWADKALAKSVEKPEMTTATGLGEKGQISRSLVNVMGRSAAGGLAGASAAKYYHKDPRAGFVIGALAMLGGPAAYKAVMKVPATKTMAEALIKDIDANKNVLDPPLHAKVLDKLIDMYHYVELPESAEKLRDIATRHIGAGLRRIAQQEETIKTYHEIFAALPEPKRIEFLKQYEKMAEFGGKSPHGILGDIARVFKRMNDENYDYLQPKLERFNKATGRKGAAKLFLAYDTETNFFPRYYKDINRARQFYTGATNASPNFLKTRYYTFVEDALKSGLELRSTNPVDMQMFRNIHTAEFGKMLDTVSEALENNLVRVVKPGRRLPKEWDSISLGRLGLLAGPKDVIRSLRYMTSPSLAQHGWYRGLRAIAESNVRANLAFSMAHTLMESVNSSVHHASLAARAFLSGQLERSAKEALYAVPFVAPVKALKKRSLIEAAYLGEKNVPKFARDVADLMERSGLTIGTRAHFGTKAIKNFKTALLENRKLAAIGHAPFAFFEKIASPIMEYFVPAVKYEAFAHEMEYYLSKSPEEIAKLGGIERVARKVADSIEYRFGEMNYKRKFWNRTARDMGHVSMISVGWNSGTAFEFGGGVTDALRLASGKKVLGTRIGFTLTYPFIVAMIGAVYQYLHTGKEPESTLDLFYPRDGGTNPDGSESRRFILNYLKDAKSLEELGPMRVAAHKMTRIWGTLAEALIWNRDYWNNMIYDPDKDSLLKKGYLVMKHVFGAYNPFVVSNAARAWNEASRESSSWKVINTAENVAGIITAPKYATQTPLQKKIYKVAARVYSRVKTPTEKKQSEIRRQMRILLQRGKKIPVELFNQARQLGMFQTSRSAKAFLKTATLPNDIRVFSTFPSQIQVELLMGSKNPANVGRYLFYMHKQAAYDYIKLMLVAGRKDVLKQAYLYALHQPQRVMKIKLSKGERK